ncbi:caspase activity and apoptosis inhibitor 1-like [Dendronephthya gigantea]|uniref:caspase activity and apoptosis inhibitor 1-like n=1 Tax=Dendronephthya gigantea TaxID=151771 RepID=UPI00106D630E|nr:caspase activity and apoptosis inhibitor 1-like [Dendronephthya gigantea]
MADEDQERFSPDSSTQILNKEKRKNKKKKKHKHRSKKKRRRHSDERTSDQDEQHSDSSNISNATSDDEGTTKQDLEFVIDIKPLTEYIDDRKELNNELFKILGRKDMKKLMTKSVKKLDVEELKSRCLDQLEIISKKRLLRIIEGQAMTSSSSESEAANTHSAMDVDSSTLLTRQPDTSGIDKDESVNILEELSVGPDQNEINELIEGPVENIKPEVAVTGQESPVVDTLDKDPVDTESQLLELEFRARALKSLMQARHKVDT